jgi:hypothetical protein
VGLLAEEKYRGMPFSSVCEGEVGMSKEIFKMSRERREKARLRMQNRDRVRGSDKEYYEALLKNYIQTRNGRI